MTAFRLPRARRAAALPAAASALLALTACAGPSTPINASLKEFPQNVRIGATTAKPTAIVPVPPAAPQVTGGLYTPFVPRPPAGGPEGAPSAPPPPVVPVAAQCWKAKPGSAARLPAGASVAAAPAAARYAYRTAGKHAVGGASASTTDYPAEGTRTVGRAVAEQAGPTGGSGTFTYDVTATLGSHSTVTTYRVVPEGTAGAAAPGLYVTSVATLGADGKAASAFTPQPPMLVLPFPADEGSVFSVVATDPSSGTTVSYAGRVGPKVQVDACGDLVDTRSVAHEGSVSVGGCGSAPCPSGKVDSTDVTSFVAEYRIATQYGGLSVQDAVKVSGSGLDAPFTDELRGTISTVPVQPAP